MTIRVFIVDFDFQSNSDHFIAFLSEVQNVIKPIGHTLKICILMTYLVDEWEHKSVNSCNIVKFVFKPSSLRTIWLQVETLSSFLSPTLLILLGSECECRARRWLGCTFSILVVTVLLQVVLPRLPHSEGSERLLSKLRACYSWFSVIAEGGVA